MAEILSDLCNICNNNASKYRCPGCSARTCSLPCYKRHQQWAQCSGKRDPTKYVKKSQLATPAGIDHDFNFIADIERKLDRAERDAVENFPNAANETQPLGQRKSKSKLTDSRLNKSGVTVKRAPKGMSRQIANNSRVSARGHITWTIEWIHGDQSRDTFESREPETISEAYQFLLRHKNGETSRKRKRNQPREEIASETQQLHAQRTIQDEDQNLTVENSLPNEVGEPTTAGRIRALGVATEDGNRLEGLSNRSTGGDEPDANTVSTGVVTSSSKVAAAPSKDADPTPSAPRHFYLHKPRTSSSKRVLIPLSPKTSLQESLRNRTVLEFPTIYVLPQVPDSLPPEYQLEADYLVQASAEQKELEELLANVHPEGLQALKGEEGEDTGATTDELDGKKILEVLKRDINARA